LAEILRRHLINKKRRNPLFTNAMAMAHFYVQKRCDAGARFTKQNRRTNLGKTYNKV